MSRPGVPAAGPTPIRSVTVAIPSCNGRRHLEACIPAVKRQLDPGVRWEVAVLDNASTDGTGAWLRRARPEVRVRRADRNLGFAAACNRLATDSEADAVAFLNDDALPREDRLAALVRRLNEAPSEVVAVGGLVLDWRGERLDFAGGIMTFDGHAFQHDLGRPLSEITIRLAAPSSCSPPAQTCSYAAASSSPSAASTPTTSPTWRTSTSAGGPGRLGTGSSSPPKPSCTIAAAPPATASATRDAASCSSATPS